METIIKVDNSYFLVELKEKCKLLKLSGYIKLRKNELIEFINNNVNTNNNNNIENVIYETIKYQKCNKNLAYWLSDALDVCGICSSYIIFSIYNFL